MPKSSISNDKPKLEIIMNRDIEKEAVSVEERLSDQIESKLGARLAGDEIPTLRNGPLSSVEDRRVENGGLVSVAVKREIWTRETSLVGTGLAPLPTWGSSPQFDASKSMIPAVKVMAKFGYNYQRFRKGTKRYIRDPHSQAQLPGYAAYYTLETGDKNGSSSTFSMPVHPLLLRGEKEPNSTHQRELDTPHEYPITLTDFPYEILVFIISHLDLGTATFLSTTCKTLHLAYKSIHQEKKVSLLERCYAPDGRVRAYLGDMLESWMEPQYRRMDWSTSFNLLDPEHTPPQYLNRKVYGDRAGQPGDELWEKENALFWRYMDYHDCEVVTNASRGFAAKLTLRREAILPHPFNKCEDWDVEAKRAVIEDANLRRYPDWCQWVAFWQDAEIFRRISLQEKLRVLQEMEAKYRTRSRLSGVIPVDVRGWLKRQRRLFLWRKLDLPGLTTFPKSTRRELRWSSVGDRAGTPHQRLAYLPKYAMVLRKSLAGLLPPHNEGIWYHWQLQ